MSKAATNSILGRHLYRLGLQLRSSHRRHRSTLANVTDDVQPSHDTGSITPQPVPTKSYKELPSPAGYPVLGTLPKFVASGGIRSHHKYVSQLHQELGSVFRDNMLGMELVFVSDQAAVREIFAAEGQYPEHFIPEQWLLYNKDRQVRRGIFFM